MLNPGESAFDYRSEDHEVWASGEMSPKALSLTVAPVAGARNRMKLPEVLLCKAYKSFLPYFSVLTI